MQLLFLLFFGVFILLAWTAWLVIELAILTVGVFAWMVWEVAKWIAAIWRGDA